MFRSLAAIVGSVIVLATIAGCSSAPAETVELSSDTILIDVRTPEEYAGGYLDGSTMLDLSGGQFAETLPTLDPEAEYAVYCRSGSRSGQAAAMMEEAGFENVIDLGSMENAAKVTQIEIVR
jgi:rhodanese-related sulfurtransferase